MQSIKTEIQSKKINALLLGVLAVGISIFMFNYCQTVVFPTAKVAQAAGANIKVYLRAAPINVVFENQHWTANSAEIRSWLTDGSANPSNFVAAIANQVNVGPTQDRDGRAVDTNDLTQQIKNVLASGQKNQTITLKTSVIARNADAQAGRYQGRYIDVNLSNQTLYAFDTYNLANQFLVSTGQAGFATPTGEFHIYGQDRSARMHGPGYYLPNVPYISWFYGDYSIHGTYWHDNFGHVMSHGCVNAPTDQAEWIFNWAGIGTPVYVHY